MAPKKEVDFSILKQIDVKPETNTFSSDTHDKNSTELSFDNNIKKQMNGIENLIKQLINSKKETQKIDLDFHEKVFKIEKNDKSDIVKNTELTKFKNVNNNLFSLMNINRNNNDFLENNYGKKNVEGNKGSDMKSMINNKLVYSNFNETDFQHNSNNFLKSKKNFFIDVGRKRSKYRGVSKNGNQWQVLIMINKNKSYAGTYTTEDFAARVYDILAIKNKGDRAKTNFIYNESQIKKICNTDIDIKSKNFNKIIYSLIQFIR